MQNTLARAGFAGLVAGTLALAPSAAEAAPLRVTGARCPTGAATAHIHAVLRAARYRYSRERVGLAVHVAFRRVEHDGALMRALRAGDLRSARARADQLLVGHIVRIRIRSGSHVLVDANPTSFAVGGTVHSLRVRGRTLRQCRAWAASRSAGAATPAMPSRNRVSRARGWRSGRSCPRSLTDEGSRRRRRRMRSPEQSSTAVR